MYPVSASVEAFICAISRKLIDFPLLHWFRELHVLPLAPEIWPSQHVSGMQKWCSLVCRERNKRVTIQCPCLLINEWVSTEPYLLVMPPPGGSPGMSSAAKNLMTYKRSGSSSLDLIAWMISVKCELKKRRRLKWWHSEGRCDINSRFPVGMSLEMSRSPSTFMSMCFSSSASCCSASCDTWGAPGKQMMMMLMLSKLPCRGRRRD